MNVLKKITLLLLACLLSLGSYNAGAQPYEIQIDQNPSLDKFCMNLVGIGHTLRLYNNGVHVTSGVSFYITGWQSLGFQGNWQTFGTNCGPQQGGYELYMPGNVHTTAYFHGQATIYAVMNNCVMATKVITIYPDHSSPYGHVDNGFTGPTQIGAGGYYTLNSSTLFANGGTLVANSGSVNVYLQPYYSVSTTTSGITVTPLDKAPIMDPVTVTADFVPAGSPCSGATYSSIVINRNPHITHNLPTNMLCGGSATFTVNVEDISNYPNAPTSPNDRHFTYQWYKDGVAISGANSRTYIATSPGTYQVVIQEYKYDDRASAWELLGEKESNGIDMTGPSAIAPDAGYTINGNAPAGAPTGTLLFNCSPITFASTTTGIANYYLLEIFDGNNTLVGSSTGYTAPPASLDIRTLLSPNYAGAVRIKLTTSTGCPGYADDSYEGYINIVQAPSPNMTVGVNTTLLSPYSQVNYPTASTDENAPDQVGRYTTTFSFTGNFGQNATACAYSLELEQWNTGTLSWDPVWVNNNLPVSNCGGGISTPISIATLGQQSGGTPFFASTTNAPVGSIWRLSTKLINDCGTSPNPLIAVFQLNSSYLRGTGVGTTAAEDQYLTVAPVPFTNELNITLNAISDSRVSLHILSVDGKLMQEVWKDESVEMGHNTLKIKTDDWPAGMYFYRLGIDGEYHTGKIMKQ